VLTFKDCLGLSELSEEEIDAIAEHEHLPLIVALEFGNALIHRPGGDQAIAAMIGDDITEARTRGDDVHALALELVLEGFAARLATAGQNRPCPH
jgi:hypothetical protein